jgi:hypothetical protein
MMKHFIAAIAVGVLIAGCAARPADFNAQPRPIDHAPEIKQSLELRARYNIPSPDSAVTIYVDSISVHHLREEFSTVATRDADGRWHVSVVGEEGPGLLKIEPHLDSNNARTLSEAEGRHLDRLLNQGDLYRERSEFPKKLKVVGAAFHTMEIDTPRKHLVVRWVGRLRGLVGAVADLVMGHD